MQQTISMHAGMDAVHIAPNFALDFLLHRSGLELIRESMLPDENASARQLIPLFYQLVDRDLKQPLSQQANTAKVVVSLLDLQPRLWSNLPEQATSEIQYKMKGLVNRVFLDFYLSVLDQPQIYELLMELAESDESLHFISQGLGGDEDDIPPHSPPLSASYNGSYPPSLTLPQLLVQQTEQLIKFLRKKKKQAIAAGNLNLALVLRDRIMLLKADIAGWRLNQEATENEIRQLLHSCLDIQSQTHYYQNEELVYILAQYGISDTVDLNRYIIHTNQPDNIETVFYHLWQQTLHGIIYERLKHQLGYYLQSENIGSEKVLSLLGNLEYLVQHFNRFFHYQFTYQGHIKYCPGGKSECRSDKDISIFALTDEKQGNGQIDFSSTPGRLLFTGNSADDDPEQPEKQRHTQDAHCPLCNHGYCSESVFSEGNEYFNVQGHEPEGENVNQYHHGDTCDSGDADEIFEPIFFQSEQVLPVTTMCQQEQQGDTKENAFRNEDETPHMVEMVYDRCHLHPGVMHLQIEPCPSDNKQVIAALKQETSMPENSKAEAYDSSPDEAYGSSSDVITVTKKEEQDIPVIEPEEEVEVDCLKSMLDLVQNTKKTHYEFNQPFHPDLFLFGEECEYRTSVEGDLLKGMEELSRLLMAWSLKVKAILASLNEKDFSLIYYAVNVEKNVSIKLTDEEVEQQIITSQEKFSEIPVRVHDLVLYRAKLRTKHWQCIAFRDACGALSFLEFNVSPYSLDGTFFIGNQYYSTYQLCDRFIFNFCRSENVRGTDGHKHLDIKDAIGGNTEFYFRLLVDAEDKGWLCPVFGTTKDSETFYQYVTQRRDTSAVIKLQQVIDAYNQLIRVGYVPTEQTFERAARKIKRYWVYLTKTVADTEKFVPVALPFPDRKCSNAYARKGVIKQRPGKITAEFRFFPTARSGREVFLISQLVQNWMIYLFEQQKRREPITYTPYEPYQPSTRSDLLDKYNNFLKTIGLNPDDYQCLSRL